MATKRGRTSFLINLARKHDRTLLARTIDKLHAQRNYRGLHEQAAYLLSELGDWASNFTNTVVEEDMKIRVLAGILKDRHLHDKLVCAVFNEMAKDVQNVVMDGTEAQLRYLIAKNGLEKTQEIVKKLTN